MFWQIYGNALQVLWVLLAVFVTYLLFLLNRRKVSRLSQTGLSAGCAWVVLTVLTTGVQVCQEMLQLAGVSSPLFVYWSPPVWDVVSSVIGTLFLVTACCLFGLAMRERAKSRVAPGRKT